MPYYRKVLKIKATDSPNVKYALAERAKGLPISNRVLIKGVLTWEEYCKRRATWDRIRQTIGLDAEFYEGAEVLLYPPDWLDRAGQIADSLQGTYRVAKAAGCDPGEASAETAFVAVDEFGIIELQSQIIPDSMVIADKYVQFLQRHKIPESRATIDRGGGGFQLASAMRRMGYDIRTVAFGEAISLPPKVGSYLPRHRKLLAEQKYAYTNRRAQMYGDLHVLLDPSLNPDGYGIPKELLELRRQMAPIPKIYDAEERLILPPKHRKPGVEHSTIKPLEEIIGCSPDQLDAFVLAVHALLYDDPRPVAGPIWSVSNNTPVLR